eukprot:TRINITY_DN8246_c0_g1_i1.p1 TRINITY_DN8246_c0_g1~~TRINITY_DN8246_c0_g1_i1.p1  ORF type:complete len:136 (+),score=27.02 TRINITY_DN8246_c0_g1_i1:97-504(+)
MLASLKANFHICLILVILCIIGSEGKSQILKGKYRRAAGYYTTRFGRSDPAMHLQELQEKRRDHMENLMKTSFVPTYTEDEEQPILSSNPEEMRETMDDQVADKPMLFCTYSRMRQNYVCAKVPWIADLGGLLSR